MARPGPVAVAAALVPAAVLAVDPGGLAPFGPVKWLLVPALTFGVLAWLAHERRLRWASWPMWAWATFRAVTAAATLQEPFAFHGTDAGFEPVTLPAPFAFSGVLHTHPDGGFVYAASVRRPPSSPELVLLRSLDGRTWEREPAGIAGIADVQSIGIVDGHLAVLSQIDRGAVFARLDAGGWDVTPLGDLLGVPSANGAWVSASSMGPLGVVAGVVTHVDPDRGPVHSILSSRDGREWSVQPLDELVDGNVRNITQIAVTGDRVGVSVAVGPANGMGLSRIVALVGTPR